MPFGDVLSLFTLLVVLVSAVLYLRMVGKEKDRRERHILRRYYEMGQEEQRKTKKEAADESNSEIAKIVAPGPVSVSPPMKPVGRLPSPS